MLVQKILKNEVPESITERFQVRGSDRYSLRSNKNMLTLAKPKTNAMKRSFTYMAAKVWNVLPLSLKDTSLSIEAFKRDWKTF